MPNGSAGFRWDEQPGRWNLDLGGRELALTLLGHGDAEPTAADLPRFDVGDTDGGSIVRRGVPALRVGDRLVTTVFDLLLAQYGVSREGLPGE